MDRSSLWAQGPSLIGTAGYGAVCPVVWDPWLTLVSHGDPILISVGENWPYQFGRAMKPEIGSVDEGARVGGQDCESGPTPIVKFSDPTLHSHQTRAERPF
jgi:hypothetical protein